MATSAFRMLVGTALLLLLQSSFGFAKDSNATVPLVLWHGMGEGLKLHVVCPKCLT